MCGYLGVPLRIAPPLLDAPQLCLLQQLESSLLRCVNFSALCGVKHRPTLVHGVPSAPRQLRAVLKEEVMVRVQGSTPLSLPILDAARKLIPCLGAGACRRQLGLHTMEGARSKHRARRVGRCGSNGHRVSYAMGAHANDKSGICSGQASARASFEASERCADDLCRGAGDARRRTLSPSVIRNRLAELIRTRVAHNT